MFLRTLYGSRMLQPLHPRANNDISNYWHEDTESARELARAMQEEEEQDGVNDSKADQMKFALPVLAKDTIERDLGLGNSTAALVDAIERRSFEDIACLNIDDIQNAPIIAQLSPSGLISIAAADIDEANADERFSRQLQNGELAIELIETLHRTSFQAPSQTTTTTSQSIIGNLFSLVQGRRRRASAASRIQVVQEQQPVEEEQVEKRFLSLLRRINELRSQQYDMDVTEGLPYAQIMSLPIFPYQRRNRIEEKQEDNSGIVQENTTCAICLMEFEELEQVRALTCLHIYHQKCIDPWLVESRTCPTCKHVVAVY